jgi:hypothetical protein
VHDIVLLVVFRTLLSLDLRNGCNVRMPQLSDNSFLHHVLQLRGGAQNKAEIGRFGGVGAGEMALGATAGPAAEGSQVQV